MNDGKKRIFIILALSTIFIYLIIFFGIWCLIRYQSAQFHQVLLISILTGLLVFVVLMMAGLFCLIYSLWHWKSSKRLNKVNRGIIELFYPVVVMMGKVVAVDQKIIEQSYINIINQMTVASGEKYLPKDILILAPHCLQKTQCPHKITVDVDNCHRCGQCSVHGLLNIRDQTGVRLVVVSGGTFARKFAKEICPKAIIAIACERDLTSGIQDLQKIPVVGILNERPNGPCINTSVPMCKVQQTIDYLTLEK